MLDLNTTKLQEEFGKQLQNQLEKEMLGMSDFTYMPRSSFVFSWGCEGEPKKFKKEDLIPTKIIYNNTTTICYFKDGSKEVVHCAEGEVFVKEVGVMSCIMKKLFKTRNDFKRLVNSGYMQPIKVTEEEFNSALAKAKKDQ